MQLAAGDLRRQQRTTKAHIRRILVERMEGRVNQPTVSHHLKKLEEAGLVDMRQEGRFRYYTLNQQHLTVCCGALVSNFAPDYRGSVIALEE